MRFLRPSRETILALIIAIAIIVLVIVSTTSPRVLVYQSF